jgi:hypothetical protein
MDVVIPGVRLGLLVACRWDLRDFINDIGDIGKDIRYHDCLARLSDFVIFVCKWRPLRPEINSSLCATQTCTICSHRNISQIMTQRFARRS